MKLRKIENKLSFIKKSSGKCSHLVVITLKLCLGEEVGSEGNACELAIVSVLSGLWKGSSTPWQLKRDNQDFFFAVNNHYLLHVHVAINYIQFDHYFFSTMQRALL